MMSNFDIVGDFLGEVYIRKNFDCIDKYLSPDYICHLPDGTIGREKAVALFRKNLKKYPVTNIQYSFYSDDESLIAIQIYISYKQKEKFLGFTVSEKEVICNRFKKFRLENGVITESWNYWPLEEILEKIPNYSNYCDYDYRY